MKCLPSKSLQRSAVTVLNMTHTALKVYTVYDQNMKYDAYLKVFVHNNIKHVKPSPSSKT